MINYTLIGGEGIFGAVVHHKKPHGLHYSTLHGLGQEAVSKAMQANNY